MSVAVLGATGFLGRAVVRQLSARGTATVAVVRNKEILAPEAALTSRTISTIEDVASLCLCFSEHAVEVAINLAASGVRLGTGAALSELSTNALGPIAVVEACRQADIPRFVHVGSGFEYAPQDEPTDENAPLAPVNLYGASKAAGFLMAQQVAHDSGVQMVTLRPFSFYGPGDGPNRLFPSLVRSALEKTPLHLSAGLQTRDYVHVDDVAEAVLAAAAYPEDGLFNIGGGPGSACTIRQLALFVYSVLAADKAQLRFGSVQRTRAEPPYFVADARHAHKRLHWQPHIGLEEGVLDLARHTRNK